MTVIKAVGDIHPLQQQSGPLDEGRDGCAHGFHGSHELFRLC